MLCVVLIAGAVGLALNLFFKINRIEVTGSTVYPDAALIEASAIHTGDNLFFLNKTQAEGNITADFPYVAQVRLVRKLPGTLVLAVTEREALGMIPYQDGYFLLDGAGTLLERVSTPAAVSFPVVRGVSLLEPAPGQPVTPSETEADRLPSLLTLLTGLRRNDMLALVSEVDAARPHELTLKYGRFTVLLGTSADLDFKLAFLLSASQELADSAQGTIDVSRAAAQNSVSFIPARESAPPVPGGTAAIPPAETNSPAPEDEDETEDG
ncbi:MAG: FtsQ-type POTRA domain-containing protein [Oscillospiraceae bacterium]|nr:FtsQ-type POTRA domain-containing protein [Oscillospiraceae bacterium]